MSDDNNNTKKIPGGISSEWQPLITALCVLVGLFVLFTVVFGSPFVSKKTEAPTSVQDVR